MNYRIKLLMLLILSLSSTFFSVKASDQTTYSGDYKWVISQIDLDNIRNHVSYFSNLGSLVTGYPGANEAARYIQSKFNEYGLLNVSYDEFNITVPVDYGASLTVLSPTTDLVKLYSFWPNLIAPGKTPPGGIEGKLVYVGGGSLDEMTGKPINGSIVLMDINSQYHWVNAAKFGAKAVIFIQSQTVRQELAMKILTIPFNFPRLLIKEEDASYLLRLLQQGDVLVKVDANMRWETRIGMNVIGYVKGTLYPERYFLITSRYDSFSFVPSLNPGAQDSVSPAVLLEMARFFKNNPPRYSVVFVAFAGTYLGLMGSRHFVEQKLLKDYEGFGKNVVAVLNIDLNTYTKYLAITSYYGDEGGMMGFVDISRFIRFEDSIHRSIEETLGKPFKVDKSSMIIGMVTTAGTGYGSNMGSFFPPLDHGPFIRVSTPALSWVTAYTGRPDWGTWQDTIEKINLENLREQLDFLFPAFYTFVNTENIVPDILSPWSPSYGQLGKWIDVKVKLAEYKDGWYRPIPNAYLAFKVSNWFNIINLPIYSVYVADENGYVEIHGISQGARAYIEGYVIDPETGNIIYAPDRGRYAFRHFEEMQPGLYSLSLPRYVDLGYLTLFKCGSALIFDLDDPYLSNRPLVPTNLVINDLRSHSPPDHYGFTEQYDYSGTGLSLLMIFSQPNVPIEVMLNRGKMPYQLLKGVSVREYGENRVLTFTPFKSAKEMYELNDARLKTLARSAILLMSALEKHDEAALLLEKAKMSLEQMDYATSYALAAKALSLERDVYVDVRSTMESAVYTIPFFSLMLVPFVFVLERVLFNQRGIKRLFALIIIFAVFVIGLFFLHPGFELAVDALMVVLVSVIIILVLPILGIIFNAFFGLMEGLRKKILGEHFFKSEYGKSLLISFDASIRYFRRRKMRTSLVLFSLVIVLSGIIPLVSFSPISITKTTIISQDGAPYDGIMIKYPRWGGVGGDPFRTGLGERVIEQIQALYGKNITIAPRAWRVHEGNLYGLYGQQAYVRAIGLFAGSARYDVYGIIGLTPQESEVSGVDRYLIMGRWFIRTDRYACIISNTTAIKLGINSLPATIGLWDMPLTVVGILDDRSFDSFTDLDGESMTPLEFRFQNPNNNIHISMRETLIVPYDLALSLGGTGGRGVETMIKSAAIGVRNTDQIEALSKDLFERFRLPTYIGINGKVLFISEGNVYSLWGAEQTIVPLVLAFLTIFNISLASVYERKRDIETFALVGLNPLEVSLIFIYEAISIALIGGILGFIGSVTVMRITRLFSAPIIGLNYASWTVVNAIALSMFVTIISSLYPSLRGAKMVTPSAERKWKPRTGPAGDVWEIPLPFTCERDEEVSGILSFVYEAVKDHIDEQSDHFFAKRYYFDMKGDLEKQLKILIMEEVAISPYDLGIKNDAHLIAQKDVETTRWNFLVRLTRKSGTMTDWITFCPRFADVLRKQLLLWGGLKKEAKEKYMKQGRRYFGE